MKTKTSSLAKTLRQFFTLALVFCLQFVQTQSALALTKNDQFEAPLVRGPGISQETLDAVSEAEGRSTLSDHLDSLRPGIEIEKRLRTLVERAQSAWLSGSINTARQLFREITFLTLEADWREPQREVIHYSHLRLAQSAPENAERKQWINRSIRAFPDLHPDPSLFPPPLIEEFRSERTNLLANASLFEPHIHILEARYLLVNGKRFSVSPGLKIRLPMATFRITVLSDLYGPITEKMKPQQLSSFAPSLTSLASGTCQSPAGAEPVASLKLIAVLYADDCIRIRSQSAWLAQDSETTPTNLPSRNREIVMMPPKAAIESSSRSRSFWMWSGLAVLATGSLFIAYRELNRTSGQPSEPVVKPVEREGF